MDDGGRHRRCVRLSATKQTAAKRCRIAGPITKRTTRNGVGYEFRADLGAMKHGLSPQAVRSTLTTVGAVVQCQFRPTWIKTCCPATSLRWLSDRRMPTRRCRPPTEDFPATEAPTKSWTLSEVGKFREAVRDRRLFACWLLSCYGLCRSEVLGLRWSAVDLELANCQSGEAGSPRTVKR